MFGIFPVHPLIKILCLIVLSLSLMHSHWWNLSVAGIGVLLLYACIREHHWVQLMSMLKRLRWLFASIIFFYFWFTPGTAVIAQAGSWSPSWQGMDLAAQRVLVLVLIVAGIHLILQLTPRNELIAAIYAMLYPFKRLVSPQRLALRIVLTLDAVKCLQSENILQKSDKNQELPRWDGLQQIVVANIKRIQHRANNHALDNISIPEFKAPPTVQWVLPAGMALIFVMIG